MSTVVQQQQQQQPGEENAGNKRLSLVNGVSRKDRLGKRKRGRRAATRRSVGVVGLKADAGDNGSESGSVMGEENMSALFDDAINASGAAPRRMGGKRRAGALAPVSASKRGDGRVGKKRYVASSRLGAELNFKKKKAPLFDYEDDEDDDDIDISKQQKLFEISDATSDDDDDDSAADDESPIPSRSRRSMMSEIASASSRSILKSASAKKKKRGAKAARPSTVRRSILKSSTKKGKSPSSSTPSRVSFGSKNLFPELDESAIELPVDVHDVDVDVDDDIDDGGFGYVPTSLRVDNDNDDDDDDDDDEEEDYDAQRRAKRDEAKLRRMSVASTPEAGFIRRGNDDDVDDSDSDSGSDDSDSDGSSSSEDEADRSFTARYGQRIEKFGRPSRMRVTPARKGKPMPVNLTEKDRKSRRGTMQIVKKAKRSGLLDDSNRNAEDYDDDDDDDNDGNDGPVRRSTRHRLPPLKFWKNEHVVYTRDDAAISHVMPTVVGVARAAPTPKPKRRKPMSKKTKKKLAAARKKRKMADGSDSDSDSDDDNDDGHESDDSEMLEGAAAEIDPQAMVTTDELGTKAKPVRIVAPAAAQQLRSLPAPRGVEPNLVQAAKTLATGQFSSGVVHLQPNGFKSMELVVRSEVFFVVSGKKNSVEFTVRSGNDQHEKVFYLSKGDHFYVPSGNQYSLKNRSKSKKVKLLFAIISEGV